MKAHLMRRHYHPWQSHRVSFTDQFPVSISISNVASIDSTTSVMSRCILGPLTANEASAGGGNSHRRLPTTAAPTATSRGANLICPIRSLRLSAFADTYLSHRIHADLGTSTHELMSNKSSKKIITTVGVIGTAHTSAIGFSRLSRPMFVTAVTRSRHSAESSTTVHVPSLPQALVGSGFTRMQHVLRPAPLSSSLAFRPSARNTRRPAIATRSVRSRHIGSSGYRSGPTRR